VSTVKRVLCIDLRTDERLWERAYEGGCDRLALSPDGQTLYIPSLEGPHWTVADAMSGEVISIVRPESGAHNTIYGPGGKWCYLAGLKSSMLNIADTAKHSVGKQAGPFGNVIRPFTVDCAEKRCYVNVNDLLGFEVGDLETGKPLARIEVEGYVKGPTKRHGCPSHGVALTPNEREIWLTDAFNERLHLFDATVMPPRQIESIKLRDQPGWITFSLDGQHAYPSTGEVIDAKSRRTLTTLEDELGRAVQSEKMLEIHFRERDAVACGDQFGIGRRKRR
jgi:DNA-binding beta-propeller fold protein YncE